jgi:hypothetical protein
MAVRRERVLYPVNSAIPSAARPPPNLIQSSIERRSQWNIHILRVHSRSILLCLRTVRTSTLIHEFALWREGELGFRRESAMVPNSKD